MRALSSITIRVRVQAVVIYISSALYASLLLLGDRALLSLPILALAFGGAALPWLSILLALFILESRIRHKERCSWWVYLAVLVGLSPLIGLVLSMFAP
jgi:hypothetical protein